MLGDLDLVSYSGDDSCAGLGDRSFSGGDFCAGHGDRSLFSLLGEGSRAGLVDRSSIFLGGGGGICKLFIKVLTISSMSFPIVAA